jgi:hypothetical protein
MTDPPSWPAWPGVPAAGHKTPHGWHPGPADGCPACAPEPAGLTYAEARAALMTGPTWGPGIHSAGAITAILRRAAALAPEPLRLDTRGVTIQADGRLWRVDWDDRR